VFELSVGATTTVVGGCIVKFLVKSLLSLSVTLESTVFMH